MRVSVRVCAAVAAVMFVGAASSASVVFGQVDTFDSSTMGWGNSAGSPTTQWISGGGPGGAGDGYLQMQSSGASGGSGSRLGAWNDAQWSGDFLAAGVTAITMDIAGFVGATTEMRLLFISNSGSMFTSTLSHQIASDGVWRTYRFEITEDAMTQVGGIPGYDESITDIWRMHLRHQPGPPAGLGNAPAYTGRIGVDNIRAVPGAGVPAAFVAAGLAGSRRRRPAR